MSAVIVNPDKVVHPPDRGCFSKARRKRRVKLGDSRMCGHCLVGDHCGGTCPCICREALLMTDVQRVVIQCPLRAAAGVSIR